MPLWHTKVFSIPSSLFYFFFPLPVFLSFLLRVWFRENNSFLGRMVIMSHHLGSKQCINQLIFQNGQKLQMLSIIFSISELNSARRNQTCISSLYVIYLKDNVVSF